MKPHELTTAQNTAARVLRNVYLRFLCEQTGRDPLRLTESERENILDGQARKFKADLAQLEECIAYAYSRGAERVVSRLHGHPAVDDEMLDEALLLNGDDRRARV